LLVNRLGDGRGTSRTGNGRDFELMHRYQWGRTRFPGILAEEAQILQSVTRVLGRRQGHGNFWNEFCFVDLNP
jgi:hypothetical protein